MPKIISPEIKFRAIELNYLGYPRDEISEEIGCGQGTTSNFLDEFRKEIGMLDFEAIKMWGRFLRKHKIDPNDAMTGLRVWKIMERQNVKETDLNTFFENLEYTIESNDDLTELLAEAKQIENIKRKSGKSYQKIRLEYEELTHNVPVLEKKQNTLQSNIKQLNTEQDNAIIKNKTTKEELRQFTDIKSQFKKIGLKLTELPKYQDALAEIKRHGYDATNLLNYLQQIRDLEKQIEKSNKILADYNNDIQNAKKELKSILDNLGQSKLEYKQFLEAVKIVLEFRQNGQDPATIMQWNKILQQNGLSVIQFNKRLQEYKGVVQYLNRLKNEMLSYEKQLYTLKTTVNDLSKEKQLLIEEIKLAKTELEDRMKEVKKEIEHLEATNPLRSVYESSKDIHNALPVIIILLEKLQSIPEGQGTSSFILRNSIKRLIEELKRELK